MTKIKKASFNILGIQWILEDVSMSKNKDGYYSLSKDELFLVHQTISYHILFNLNAFNFSLEKLKYLASIAKIELNDSILEQWKNQDKTVISMLMEKIIPNALCMEKNIKLKKLNHYPLHF